MALNLHHNEPARGSVIQLGDPLATFPPRDSRDLNLNVLTKVVQRLMERAYNQGGPSGADRDLFVPESPLRATITLAPTQVKINTASLDCYSGGTDPRVHVAKYNSYMGSMGATDATKCRLFSLTLGDQAHQWFTSLPPSSVESFIELARLFLTNFTALAPRPATMQRLMNTQQGDKESDRSYLERIDALMLEGDPIGDEAKVLGAITCLKKETKL